MREHSPEAVVVTAAPTVHTATWPHGYGYSAMREHSPDSRPVSSPVQIQRTSVNQSNVPSIAAPLAKLLSVASSSSLYAVGSPRGVDPLGQAPPMARNTHVVRQTSAAIRGTSPQATPIGPVSTHVVRQIS